MKTRTVSKEVRVDDLFESVGVADKQGAHEEPDYDVRIKGPTGYESVQSFFRTEAQESVRVYFANGNTLECSWDHRLKSNGRWKHVSELEKGDVVETDTGHTTVKQFNEKSEKVLYDVSVENSHAYYSNSVLSHNSWYLSALGYACMANGGMVAHYTMELDDDYTARRYDSIRTGRTPNEIPDHREEIKKLAEETEGEAVIQRWPEKSVTAQSIHAHVERLSTLRRKPDLIVVDYADCLRAKRGMQDAGSYEAQGSVYVDLRRIGAELDIPVWTASQTNREGEETEVITADLIAESYKKVMKADFVASLSRTREDKLTNDARLHLIKNRMGPDGRTLPAKMDLSCGQIEIFEPGSEAARKSEVERKLNRQTEEKKQIGELFEVYKEKGTVPRQ